MDEPKYYVTSDQLYQVAGIMESYRMPDYNWQLNVTCGFSLPSETRPNAFKRFFYRFLLGWTWTPFK